MKFCQHCGKEVLDEAVVCPGCGCSLQSQTVKKSFFTQCTEILKKNTKPLIVVAAVAAVAIIVGLIISFAGTTLNEDEQLAYENAVEMQSMMRDPDSFRLYDEMFLLKHYDENGENDFTYTIFKYGGTNGYGAIITDEAIFKDNEYLMDYADEADKDDENYIDQLLVKVHISGYKLTGDNDTWKMIEINIEKIKDKMGL